MKRHALLTLRLPQQFLLAEPSALHACKFIKSLFLLEVCLNGAQYINKVCMYGSGLSGCGMPVCSENQAAASAPSLCLAFLLA